MSVNSNLKNFINKLKDKNIDQKVIDAFSGIDQAIFFDPLFKDKFYSDELIPIAYGEKSDNFFNLALMINHLQLKGNERVLEVGTGSGYSTSILSTLCREVITVDCKEGLVRAAKDRLYAYNFENIRFFAGDATTSANAYGKIDAVIVYSACYKRPIALMQDLVPGGTMVFPMGPEHRQQIIIMKNEPDLETGVNFKIKFREQGLFPLITGPYGYENIETAEFGDYVDTSGVQKPEEKNEDEDEGPDEFDLTAMGFNRVDD